MAKTTLTDTFIAELLALASLSAQENLLTANQLADEDGLAELLAYAEAVAYHDPLAARALTTLCHALAERFRIPTLIPRAIYLQAQTYVLRGEPSTALDLIERARSLFMAEGMAQSALRTDVGAMKTLTELGRYQEALAVGERALSQIDIASEVADPTAATLLGTIRAKIYDNQGPPLAEMGLYEEALAAYARAESAFDALNMTDDQALVLCNRGVALRYLGRVDEALDVYEQAALLLPQSGYLYAIMQNNIGDAHLLLGNYQASLAALSQAREAFADQEAEYDLQICASHLADAYLALNLYPEALALYQEAVASLEGTAYHYYVGKALWGIGSIHSRESELEEASRALERAVDLFTALENVPIVAQITLERSALYAVQGQHAAARNTAEQALDMVSGAGTARWPVQQLYAHLRLADLVLPDVAAAEDHLRQAEELLELVTLPHLRFRLLQRLGRIRRMQGRGSEAQELFEAAIIEIEQLRGSLSDEAMLVSFQQDKMAPYEALIQLHLEQIGAGEYAEAAIRRAFELIERAKSRALVERIAGIIHVATTTDADAQTVARLEAIQTSLNAIYSDLLGHDLGAPDDQETRGGRSTRMARLGRRAAELEQTQTRLRLQLAASARPVALLDAPLSLRQIQADLPDDLTIVSYHTAGDEVLAFVLNGKTIHAVRSVTTVTAVQTELQQLAIQWEQLRIGGAFVERHIARLEQNALLPLQRLYAELMGPLEYLLDTDADTPASKLVIVPHGLLHQAPFQALHDGSRYLFEKAELSYAPSASVLALSHGRSPRPSKRLLVLGVPDPAIPAVEAEAHAIAQVMPRAELLIDHAATLGALQDNVADCRVVHLACHGLFRADNPMYSALKLYDGWLTAAEATLLDFKGAAIVLSACESGRGLILAGDETIGLARAFMGAGATMLIVSQWLVQDDTGAMLMAEWYAGLARGQQPAAALRSAQMTVKSSHPHPYYWAPFVLIGSRGPIFGE